MPVTLAFAGLYWLPVLMFFAIDVILWTEGAGAIRHSEQFTVIRGAFLDPMPFVVGVVILLNVVRCLFYAQHWNSISIACFTLLHLAAIGLVPIVIELCRLELYRK